MAVEIIEPGTLTETLVHLTALSQEFPRTKFIFRGHQNSQWKLCTTYDRYWPFSPLHDPEGIKRMIAQFRAGVMKLRLESPPGNNQLIWLEYGRHHGLAVPLLDFTWSPFVALFFAFDGIREQPKPTSSAVYALNLHQLAKKIAHRYVSSGGDARKYVQVMNEFFYHGESCLTNDIPLDRLFFIHSPSAYTQRMHAQLGVFLYSTLIFNHDQGPPSNLEEFFEDVPPGFDWPSLPNDNRPIITKIILPHTWAGEVFNSLDIMRISGSTLYLSAEGVAKDVYNSYYYEPRAAFLRDC